MNSRRLVAPAKAALLFVRVLGLVGLLSVAGCVKKGGEAVVISKEHIPATVADEASKDAPPAAPEQWWVKVEMRADLRKVEVLVKQAEWEKLQVGDRVKVDYSQGKYTGTIWNSEIK